MLKYKNSKTENWLAGEVSAGKIIEIILLPKVLEDCPTFPFNIISL